jgi:SHS2 domain-containing protein
MPKTSKPDKRWRLLDHTADVRLEACGIDPEELFTVAAEGLTELLGKGADLRRHEEILVTLESSGLEELLVDWLREILFYNETRSLVLLEVRSISLSESDLTATICVAERAPNQSPEMEIKGVTYHGLSIEKTEGDYCAKIVFDI